MGFYKILIALSFFITFNFANAIDKLTIMTEEYPPYNMTKDGKLVGISVEVLELMLKDVGSKKTTKDIKVLPWARSYNMVQNKKNTMLFAMFRTKQRENLFKWVGPIDSSSIGLIAKKDRKIKIKNVADIKKYKIGTVKDDAAELALKELGLTTFDSISGTNSIATSIKKLKRNRIDLFAYVYETKSWNIDNFKPEDYENVYTLKKNDLYYAFHKDTDQKIIDKLQKSLNLLKEKGLVQEIIKKYK